MADDLIERLTERADMAEMAVARLIGERDALRAEVEQSDAALQRIGIALCGTDEWTDRATMLGSVVAVAEEFRAEIERLTDLLKRADEFYGEKIAELLTEREARNALDAMALRLTAEVEALRASVSLLEEQHQRDWAERERQSTQLLHLSDQVEALRADAARLDAIEGNLWFVEPRYQYEPAQFGVGKADTMKVAKTLRAAIDAARSAT